MEILGVGLLVLLVAGILIGLRQSSRMSTRRQMKHSGSSAAAVDPADAALGKIDEGREDIRSDDSGWD